MGVAKQAALELLAWRLYDLSGSCEFRHLSSRIDQLVDAEEIDARAGEVLKRILLLEMRERPRPIRILEWVASLVPWWGRRVTRGPLQIRRGPWRFEDAARQATGLLPIDMSAEEVAAVWNGSTVRPVGSAASYADALTLADAALVARLRR
jgi:hypothetical protein